MNGDAAISSGFSRRITRSSSTLVEPAARVAGVLQTAVFVVAKQQRAERAAGRARVGPAADDELLLVDDFQLSPVARALAGVIHGVRDLWR